MTTPIVSPFLVLEALAQTRALLFRTCEYADLEEAVAPLRDYAVNSGVVDEIGAEATWALINSAFGITEPNDDPQER